MKKIVLKICMPCMKCKRRVMKAVAKVDGISSISVDAEKELLTVVGDVDPFVVVKKLKKIQKSVTINSVGPYKKEESQKKEPKPYHLPSSCNICQPIAMGYLTYDDPVRCTIL